jgi:hypothetical protein
MLSDLPSDIQFRAKRLLRIHSGFCLALGLSLLGSLGALMAYSTALVALSDANEDQRELEVAPIPITVAVTSSSYGVPLRPFSSAAVVQSLNDAASTSNLSVDDVTFSFEETPAQPYLRYRASLTIAGNYLSTRRFVELVRTTLTDVSLDSFSCTRKDIRDTGLTCDVTFSAFYRKGGDE